MPPDPQSPTLEQLIGFLDCTVETKAFRSKDGTRTRLEFLIDNDRLAAIGASCYASGPQVAAGLLEALERLRYIDGVTKDYSNPETKGATAADCQAFIANELKHVPPTHGLESTMRRRMFNATLQKLVELGMWRAAVDAQRFQNQRETERKRREEQRKRDEDILRQQEENRRAYQERVREAEEAMRRGNSGRKSSPFGEEFAGDFWSAFGGENPDFADAFRYSSEAWRSQYQQEWPGFRSRQRENQQRQQSNGGTKARNKTRAPWYEVLGVKPNADKATIKSAWRKLASMLHPDKPENRNDPEKLARLQDVNTAKDEGLRGLA